MRRLGRVRRGKADDEEAVGGGLGGLRQHLGECELRLEAPGGQIAAIVQLAGVGDPFVDEDDAGPEVVEQAADGVSRARPRLVGSRDPAVRIATSQLPGKFAPKGVDDGAVRLSVRAPRSTDPPYYDNIGYADLSDFFYLWLRRSQRLAFPDLFATLAVPKAEELVATPYRHDTREKAEEFFLKGMTQAMGRLARQSHPAFPVTIYYAFKQAEKKALTGASTSTGWETFLGAVMQAGFSVTGTWPVRTEYTRNLKKNVAAIASSIVLVCRRRPADAPLATRREFLTALRAELPPALHLLQSGNIAPVDLAQAAIGPGMAIYTRYGKVFVATVILRMPWRAVHHKAAA